MQIPARQPAATAMAAATLDVLSGGRFRLGLGVSGPQVSEGWYGVPFARPLRRTREYVEIVRRRWPARTARATRAREWTLPLARRPGQAAEAAGQAGAGADPDLPRRDRPEGGRADGRDRRRLAAVPARPGRARRRCSSRSSAGWPSARAARSRDRHRAVRAGGASTTDVDAARDARRGPGWRSTSARWARQEKNFYVELAARVRPRRRRRARCQERLPRRATATGAAAAVTDELIDAAWRSPPRRRASTTGWPPTRPPASTRWSRCPRRRPRAASCARWPRRCASARCAEAPRRRPPGIPGSRAARARSRSATTRRRCASGCASSRACRCSARFRNLKVGRARSTSSCATRGGALPCSMWRERLRQARPGPGALADGAQVVVAGGSRLLPRQRAPRRRRSRSRSTDAAASPARATCSPSSTRLRRALDAEGLFEPQKRLPRPPLPRTIGVVTGEGGKARDDVLAGLRRRGWAGRLVWAFAPVQDRHAAPRDHAARCRTSRPASEVEVIVVARGGGSLADLFAFCDETLCRTVALLRVPVIASVGHHTDRTLIDDVAAVSCSTPTHAAEAAVPVDCVRGPRESLTARRARARRATGAARSLERARALAAPVARAGRARRAPPRARCTSSCASCAPARGAAWPSGAGWPGPTASCSTARRRRPPSRRARRRTAALDAPRRWRSPPTTPSARSSAATRSSRTTPASLVTAAEAARAAGRVDVRFHDGRRPRPASRMTRRDRAR